MIFNQHNWEASMTHVILSEAKNLYPWPPRFFASLRMTCLTLVVKIHHEIFDIARAYRL